MRVVLDENVSLGLAEPLRRAGHEVLAITEMAAWQGMSDDGVWALARDQQALLITRDYHFTNAIRFRPEEVLAVIYIRRGNLRSEEEIELVTRFLSGYDLADYAGKLITLSPGVTQIR
ncbi:MAG: DUF5615 family PIN-like protein [Anaerolineae bacterium]